jgi:predicted enzyme related to lactoylglutathione lyase
MTVSGVDATYYTTKDLTKGTAFYTDLIGSPPTMHFPNMISEWTFAGGETFGLYGGAGVEETFTPSGGVMFAVGDVPAAVAELKGKGVTLHGDIEETPVCHMAFGSDPDGNGFILHKRK